MNKAYWNGKELRGPITMDEPECIGCIEKNFAFQMELEKFLQHVKSLPVLLSSGFEGMPVGEVEYEEIYQFLNIETAPKGHCVYLDCTKECYEKTKTEFRRIIAIPATTKASEVSGEETFDDYIRNARDEFVQVFNSHERSVTLKVAVENILICFDQMRDKLTESPKYYPVWVNVYGDANGRFLGDEDYSSYQEAFDNRDKLSTYRETVAIIRGNDQPTPSIPIREAVEAWDDGSRSAYDCVKPEGGCGFDAEQHRSDCRTYFLNKFNYDIDKEK